MRWAPPLILPARWRPHEIRMDGARYLDEAASLVLIISSAIEQDEKKWIHLSLSHAHRIPKWRELREAKDVFLGDVKAIQVLPTKAEYVNIHPHVLHLWYCPDGDGLPDFTHGSGSI